MKKIVLVLMALLLSAVSFGQIDVSPTTFHNGINLPNAVEDNAPDSLLTITGEGEVQYVLKSSIQADETDPVYLAEPASNITSTDITNWNASEPNVQSDWNVVSGDAFILNKPTIPDIVLKLEDTIRSPIYDFRADSTKIKAITLNGVENNTVYRFNSIDLGVYNSWQTDTLGAYSFRTGFYSRVPGSGSAAIGSHLIVEGDNSVAMGFQTLIKGDNSMAFGSQLDVIGDNSIAFGRQNTVNSDYSAVFGYGNTVSSQNAFAIGFYSTNATISSRIFNVGNGNYFDDRSDAFTILKNGQTSIGIDNFEANTTGELLQVNGKVKATQYKLSTLNTAPTSANDTGETGEIRITSNYIYVCIATNTWVRAALTTW